MAASDHPNTPEAVMIFAEELGPMGWSAVIGGGLAAVVSALTAVHNLRRAARKEDADNETVETDRIIAQQREMYDRAKEQYDADREEFRNEINGLKRRVTRTEQAFDRVKTMYVQEVAKGRYHLGLLKQHKIEFDPWDISTVDMPGIDPESDLAADNKTRPAEGKS